MTEHQLSDCLFYLDNNLLRATGFRKHSYCLRISGWRVGQQPTPSQYRARLEGRRPRSGKSLIWSAPELLGDVAS